MATVKLDLIIAETSRLQLRRFSPGDAQGLLELNADPEVLRYTGDPPFADLAAARNFLASYDHYERFGFGRWTVVLRETGAYLGFCGLKCLPDLNEVDLGFRFKRNFWGRGLATEAGRLALAIGFRHYGLATIVGRAMPENLASHAVLKKLGMSLVREFVDQDRRWCQYELVRADFTDGLQLRAPEVGDLAALFQHQCDDEANHMAGFTAEDPHDEAAFRAKMHRIMANPETEKRVIEVAGQVVGNVMAFEMFGKRSVCYWLGREHWGRGYATRGLQTFLDEHKVRPLCARVAADNAGSIRVLEKCGFVVIGEDVGFAHGRGQEIRELILCLDEGARA